MEKEELEIIQEEHKEEGERLKYSGDITITLMDGDRVISKKKCHNTGCAKLFMFFTSCLAGEWSAAKSARPCKLVLFDKNPDETLYKTVPGSDKPLKVFNATYWTDNEKISTIILHDGAVLPTPKYERINDEMVCVGYAAKYHFRVPYLCLVNRRKVFKMAIYPETITSLKTDMSAYYIVDKDCEIQIPDAGGNFTVIVDWTLNIVNA